MKKALVLAAMFFTTPALTASAVEWKTVELSGVFRGQGLHNIGKGKTEYSFALEEACESSGDLRLEVSFGGDGGSVEFRLNKYWFVSLGPLSAPPTSISVPSDFATEKWRLKEPSHMIIGHYYVLAETGHFVLIQVLSFKCAELKRIPAGLFGSVHYIATCSVSFRHFTPAQSLDGLVSLISRERQNAVKPPEGTSPPKKGPEKERGNAAPPSTEAGPLVAACEQFQIDAKAFLDLPTEQATVSKCDILLDTAKNLTTRINDQIGEVDSTITGNGAKVSSLNERLAKITDLQLKDRTQTRISKIREETERLQKDLKEWTAKLNELQKTEKTLREYRLIIGI